MKDVLYWEAAEFYEPLYRRGLARADGLAHECDAIEEILLRNAGIVRRVMDAGCGTGVHSVELSSRGYEMVAYDFSDRMVEIARGKRLAPKARVTFLQADMRKYVPPRKCDAVICMTNAYLNNYTPEQAHKALSCFAASLRRGGVLLLEVTDYGKSIARGDFAFTYVDRAKVGRREVVEVIESEANLRRHVLLEHGTYFVSHDDGSYSRHSSNNTLALINPPLLEYQLSHAGFELREIVDAETRKQAGKDSTEYFVVAVKQ